jgi:hypothetical protein
VVAWAWLHFHAALIETRGGPRLQTRRLVISLAALLGAYHVSGRIAQNAVRGDEAREQARHRAPRPKVGRWTGHRVARLPDLRQPKLTARGLLIPAVNLREKPSAITLAEAVARIAGVDRILARLRTLRSDLIDPTIAVHHGRIISGGSVIEFRSVVDAVNCASEVQRAMVERNAEVTPDKRIEFRIGIHLGDVVEESDGDLMGDGVNIAARLQGVAKPGAICLSEQAYWQVKGRLDLAVTDLDVEARRRLHAADWRWANSTVQSTKLSSLLRSPLNLSRR